jgi:hypothetical protein
MAHRRGKVATRDTLRKGVGWLGREGAGADQRQLSSQTYRDGQSRATKDLASGSGGPADGEDD